MEQWLAASKIFRQWLSQPLGQRLLALEAEQLDVFLPRLFGYHFLMLGEPQFAHCVLSSPISHQILVNPAVTTELRMSPLCASQDKLPILTESIDVAYLPHCLCFTPNSHEVLREIYRVLRSQGHVIISGFNPWSLGIGWQRFFFKGFLARKQFYFKLISLFKLKDWLALLGFQIVDIRHYGYQFPLNHHSFMEKTMWMENLGQNLRLPCAANYAVLACKRITTLTAVRPQWRHTTKLVRENLVESSPQG